MSKSTIQLPVSPEDVQQGPFEGVEKRVIIQFHDAALKRSPNLKNSSLRSLTQTQWQSVLDEAGCQILSQIELAGACTAYLLSESSLFVYDSRVVLKTCGTTTPLLGLHVLFRLVDPAAVIPKSSRASASWLTTCSSVSSYPDWDSASPSSIDVHDPASRNNEGFNMVEWLLFTHLNYCFPEKQKYPHRSFDEEVVFLLTTFPESAVVGIDDKVEDGPTLARFSLQTSPGREFFVIGFRNYFPTEVVAPEIAIDELMMLGVRRDSVERFAGLGLGNDALGPRPSTVQMKMIMNSGTKVADEYWFTPHGYSCNILDKSKRHYEGPRNPCDDDGHLSPSAGFITTHISPEPGSSYASIEWCGCNVDRSSVDITLDTFQPSVVHLVEVRLGGGLPSNLPLSAAVKPKGKGTLQVRGVAGWIAVVHSEVHWE